MLNKKKRTKINREYIKEGKERIKCFMLSIATCEHLL